MTIAVLEEQASLTRYAVMIKADIPSWSNGWTNQTFATLITCVTNIMWIIDSPWGVHTIKDTSMSRDDLSALIAKAFGPNATFEIRKKGGFDALMQFAKDCKE